MKKPAKSDLIIAFLLMFSTIFISAQEERFFENGKVQLKNPVEKINLTYLDTLPFVKVIIGGKTYNFLFDTGAPTIISHQIYTRLKLKKTHQTNVKDSQNNNQEQIFTELPEMKIDQVIFKNIGAIVMDLNKAELGCYKIDGIIGSNQMAKLFWRINYSENSMEVTKNLSLFDLKNYDVIIPVKISSQKTPSIETEMFDKKLELMFDTGFGGRLYISDTHFDSTKVKKALQTFGTSSVGAFGAGKPIPGYIFTINELTLGNKTFQNEIISTANVNVIGNKFFEDFTFILDWENNKIYMKRIKSEPPKLESFGFGYRFIDAKPIVALVYQDENLPLKIMDSVISINHINLDSLNNDSACHYMINRVEKGLKTMDIKIKRDGKIMDFKIERKIYLGN